MKKSAIWKVEKKSASDEKEAAKEAVATVAAAKEAAATEAGAGGAVATEAPRNDDVQSGEMYPPTTV